MKKLFLLGVDGVTFDLLEPWVKQGLLPGFGRLMAEGCHANLMSSIPPLSPVAWTGIATGVNPGKHFVHDFFQKKEVVRGHQPIFTYVTGGDRRTKAFWEILSEKGKRGIVINMPCSYPPDPLNGLMISGWDGAKDQIKSFYPASFHKRLTDKYGPYYIVPLDLLDKGEFAGSDDASKQKLRDALIKMVRQKRQIFMDLAENEQWDYFFGVFTETDTVQHRFWNTVREKDPARNAILAIYMEIDLFVQDLLNKFGNDVDVMVVSDHGFGPLLSGINLNFLLEDHGYLKRNLSIVRSLLFATLFHLQPLRNAVKRFVRKSWMPQKLSTLKPRHLTIDFKRSRVFFEGAYSYFHVIPPAKPEDLLPKLKELLEPLEYKGNRVFSRICMSREIFTGPYVDDIPHIVGIMNDTFEVSGAEVFMSNQFNGKQVFCPHLWEGNHKENGIFIYRGTGGRPKQSGPLQVMDIAPTVLGYFGLPVPGEMDGRVIPSVVPEDQVVRDDYNIYKDPSVWSPKQSDEDAAVLKERLEALGYL